MASNLCRASGCWGGALLMPTISEGLSTWKLFQEFPFQGRPREVGISKGQFSPVESDGCKLSLKFLGAALPCCMAELNPEIFNCESVATKHDFVTSAVVHQLLKVGRGEQKIFQECWCGWFRRFDCSQPMFLFSIKLESICGWSDPLVG